MSGFFTSFKQSWLWLLVLIKSINLSRVSWPFQVYAKKVLDLERYYHFFYAKNLSIKHFRIKFFRNKNHVLSEKIYDVQSPWISDISCAESSLETEPWSKCLECYTDVIQNVMLWHINLRDSIMICFDVKRLGLLQNFFLVDVSI